MRQRTLWTRLALATLTVAAGTGAALANQITVPNGTGNVQCAATHANTNRFAGNCGAKVDITGGDPAAAYVQDNSPTGESTYRARLYVNLRTLTMANGDEFDLFRASDGSDPVPPATSGNPVIRLAIRQTGAQKQLVVTARLDAGTEQSAAVVNLATGGRSIEIDWARATAAGANNGRLGFWVDGAVKTGLTGLDNDTLSVNYVRWGAVANLDTGTSGTFRMDDFSSQRTGYIGPAFPFSDVATSSPFFPFIQGIYAAEVIPECAIGSFCSENAIARKEMAKFLLLAKNGASYTPPACVTPIFSDVPCSHPYATWINEIANEGITSGCAPGVFCPDGNITRSQMSVFLMVAAAATPADCGGTSPFADVPAGSPFCKWIKEIANRGITAGCGGGNFCPENLVLRGQMSVFLATTFTIPTHVVGP
jgi:hypothetical protein